MSLKAFYLRNLFWFNDWRKGSPIGRQYREIKFIQEHSAAEGEPLRKAALEALLRYAQTNTDFYSNHTSLDLADYPIMNKLDLIENYDKIKVEESRIPDQEGPVYVQKTSGSTGTPFTIFHDTRKRQRRIAELKYFGKIVGFNSHEKLIHLRAWNRYQNKSTDQARKENIIPFNISRMSDPDLKELFDLIYKEKAVCLRCYASPFKLIADYARRHSDECPPSKTLKISIAGGEMLPDDVRPMIKKYVGGDIISQYANEECGILAQERVPTSDSDNVMYMNNASYIIEVLKFDRDEPAEYGELGRIVITDLHNLAFPVIRYDNGDAAILQPPDQYSNGYPVIGKLYGRRLDIVYTTNGEPVHPIALGREFKHYSKIRQWQFIQTDGFKYKIKVSLYTQDDRDEVMKIVEPLEKLLGKEARFDFEFVDEIPVLASGKRKMVINEWKQ